MLYAGEIDVGHDMTSSIPPFQSENFGNSPPEMNTLLD